MLILWIRKTKEGELSRPPKKTKDSLKKHNEDMKNFHLAHPKIETTSSRDIRTPDGDILAAVQNVKLTRHTQN